MGETELKHDFWMDDIQLFNQWTKVLRFQVGREVALFNEHREEKLYKIVKIGNNAVHVEHVTDLVAKTPKKELYLGFSLLKKDKVDWILQKGTELGVRHFVPLFSDRTEKTGFNVERAEKIVIEAAEQCGRVDIPSVREPITPQTFIKEMQSTKEFQGRTLEIYVAEEGGAAKTVETNKYVILIGPEGGWSDDEKRYFEEHSIPHLHLSEFTLRAETAAVSAATLLQ